MTGLDTNVIVRYLVKDNPEQTKAAVELIKSFTPTDKGFISLPVMVETIWVLESRYELDKTKIKKAVSMLIHSNRLIIQSRDDIEAALTIDNAHDFPDAIIAQVGLSSGCDKTVTFDRKAAKIEGMELLQ